MIQSNKKFGKALLAFLFCFMLLLPPKVKVEASVEQGDIEYILDVRIEPDRASFPPDEEPSQVGIKFYASCFGRDEDGRKVMFPGGVSVTYQIFTGNGTMELDSYYEIRDPELGIYMSGRTEYVTMGDDLWTVRVLIESEPSTNITVNDIYIMRKGSLVVAVHDDYYENFADDMPGLLCLFHDAYRELIELGGLGAPLTLTLQTLCEVCMVAWSGYTVCPLSYGRESHSFYSDFMRDDAFILGIFHEMTHALLNVNFDIFYFHGTINPAYQGEWFIEGEANYVGSYLLPKYLAEKADDFVLQSRVERYEVIGQESFKLMLENNGTIMNTIYRTTSMAGTPLQLGSHPEVEGHGLLRHTEENYRPDYLHHLYGYLREFFGALPSEYADWKDVWEGMDLYSMDTILIGLMAKAACADLTPLFDALSFQLYGLEELETLIDPEIYEAYSSLVGGSSTSMTSMEVEVEPASTDTGERYILRASLLDGSGAQIEGESVDFYIGDDFIGSNVTGDLGVALIETDSYEVGQYNITACYAGTPEYRQCLGRVEYYPGSQGTRPEEPSETEADTSPECVTDEETGVSVCQSVPVHLTVVDDEERSLEDAEVFVTYQDGEAQSYGYTDSSGCLSFETFHLDLDIAASKSGYSSASTTLDESNVILDGTNLNLVLTPLRSTVSMRVEDAKRSPLDGVTICSVTQPEGVEAMEKVTGDDGTVELPDMVSGYYRFTFTKEGYDDEEFVLNLGKGEVKEVTVTLTETQSQAEGAQSGGGGIPGFSLTSTFLGLMVSIIILLGARTRAASPESVKKFIQFRLD